jgi:hypothetical protein
MDSAMKKLLLAGCVALFLATPAQADCCDMAPLIPAGREFEVAAKRQFGRGFASVGLWGKQWRDYSDNGEEVLRDFDGNWPPPEHRNKSDCLSKGAVVTVKNRRYLGLDWDKSYLVCRYRTKPTIRFFKCTAWEGE